MRSHDPSTPVAGARRALARPKPAPKPRGRPRKVRPHLQPLADCHPSTSNVADSSHASAIVPVTLDLVGSYRADGTCHRCDVHASKHPVPLPDSAPPSVSSPTLIQIARTTLFIVHCEIGSYVWLSICCLTGDAVIIRAYARLAYTMCSTIIRAACLFAGLTRPYCILPSLIAPDAADAGSQVPVLSCTRTRLRPRPSRHRRRFLQCIAMRSTALTIQPLFAPT